VVVGHHRSRGGLRQGKSRAANSHALAARFNCDANPNTRARRGSPCRRIPAQSLQLTRPRARPAGARFSRQRRRAMPEAGLSPSSMDNWKAGIRDRLLREPSRNGDPGAQTTRKPGECRIRAPLDLRRRNPLSLKQPSAKRTVDSEEPSRRVRQRWTRSTGPLKNGFRVNHISE
jgi:hypothetical protein